MDFECTFSMERAISVKTRKSTIPTLAKTKREKTVKNYEKKMKELLGREKLSGKTKHSPGKGEVKNTIGTMKHAGV